MPSGDRLTDLFAAARRDATGEDVALQAVSLSLTGRPDPQRFRYDLQKIVGAGGHGVVYRAWDSELDRPVAIKLFRASRRAELEATLGGSAVRNEARAMARLSHPNIVAVYDIGELSMQSVPTDAPVGDSDTGTELATAPGDGVESSSELYLVMEFVDGGTARTWLESGRTRNEILALFTAAGEGLAALHAAGLVHRDFKPSNVLTASDGRVLVSDFGIASLLDGPDTEPSGQPANPPAIAGTPRYMAPEQHDGVMPDPRADQYSYCVALFEAVFGRPPFSGTSPAALWEAKAAGRIEWPNDAGPRWLVRALKQGLDADPVRRHRDMRALLQRLQGPGRKRLFVATAAVVVGVLAGAVLIPQAESAEDCQADGLASQWSDATRTRIRAAFESTQGDWEPGWKRFAAGADALAERWRRSWDEACPQTGAEVTDRRACLVRQRRQLGELVEALTEEPAATVDHALRGLAAVERYDCDDPLGSTIAGTAGADLERVNALREGIDRVELLGALGQRKEALAVAQSLVEHAKATDDGPTMAEFTYRYARALHQVGQIDEAVAELERAFHQAVQSNHDEIAAGAASAMVLALGQRGDFDEAKLWAQHATSAVGRIPWSPRLDGELNMAVGQYLLRSSQTEEAAQTLQRARDSLAEAYGDDHPVVAIAELTIADADTGLGRFEEALKRSQRALATLEAAHGRDHPRVALAHGNVATALAYLERLDESIVHRRAALEIETRRLTPEHPNVLNTRANLALNLIKAGQHDRAIEILREVGSAYRKAGNRSALAQALLALGSAIGERSRYADALPQFEEAAQLLRSVLDEGNPRIAAADHYLGVALADAGQNDAALEAFARAITARYRDGAAVEPSALIESLRARAELQGQHGASGSAVEDLQLAVTLTEQLHDPQTRAIREAGTRFDLARALIADGRDRVEARALAERAAAAYRAAGHSDELAEIEQWLQDTAN